MEALTAPQGLIVDLITPLNDDGSIDGHGLGKLLDHVAPNAQALLLAGPRGGEGKHLNSEQRLELLEKAIVALRQMQVPLLVWISQNSPERTIHTIKTLKKAVEKHRYAGRILWVDTPLYYHSNRGLPAHYHDICSELDVSFVLYNDPEFVKGPCTPLKRNNIRTKILKELTSEKNILGLIYLGSLERAHNYQKACRKRVNFRIYDGEEAVFLDHPSISGALSIGANLAPKAWQEICRSSLQLSTDKLNYPDQLQYIWELGHYLRALESIYFDKPIPLIKAVLYDIGVIQTPNYISPTKDEVTAKARQRAKTLMSRYGDTPE